MRIPFFTLFLFFYTLLTLHAQPDYGFTYGDPTSNEYLYTALPTADGNVVLGGGNEGDFWLLKVALDGSLLWERSTSGNGILDCEVIKAITDEEYICAGPHHYTKVDSSGNILWQRTNYNQFFQDIHLTSDGGYITAGYDSIGNSETARLNKLDVLGNVSWSQSLNSSNTSHFTSVLPLNNGEYLVTGDEFVAGATKGLLQQRNNLGAVVWSKSFEGFINKAVPSSTGGYWLLSNNQLIEVDAIGDSLTTIPFLNHDLLNIIPTADNGYALVGALNSNNSYIGLLIKLDSSGNVLWTQQYPDSNGNIFLYDVQELSNGQFILTGGTQNELQGYFIAANAQGVPLSTTFIPSATTVLQLSPNPTTDWVTLHTTDLLPFPLQAKLVNVAGQVVKRFSINTASSEFSMAQLPNGLYILHLEESTTTYKIIKK